MFKIKTFNKIDPLGLKKLSENITVSDDGDYDAIILRSYQMSEAEITDRLCGVARAGAGVNNIPVDTYAKNGIVVFNTPGANANAVKELAVLAMLLAGRKVTAGIDWLEQYDGDKAGVEKAVEAGKSQFTGPELIGKKAGIIGLGAIGAMVANTLTYFGMEVYGFDPFISVDSAWKLRSAVKRAPSAEWIFENCDYVSLHIPLNDKTKNYVDEAMLSRAKDGIRIINLARGGLVADEAVIKAVESGKAACYVTDFPNGDLLGHENIIAIPHLGASTPESEINCAVMAAEEISDFLNNGNIRNSVNYPACAMARTNAASRLTVCNLNVPNMVGQITAVLAADNINIANMLNASKGEYAYTIIDTDSEIADKVLEDLRGIEGVLKVRKID